MGSVMTDMEIKCLKCGKINASPDARFCMACGAALKRPEPVPEVVGHDQISKAFREKQNRLLDGRYAALPEPSPDAPKKTEAPALCPQCKSKLTPDAVLCIACGFDLRSGRRLPSTRRNQPRPLARFLTALLNVIGFVVKSILCVIVVVIILYAGSTFFKKEAPPESAEKTDNPASPPAAVTKGPFDTLESTVELAAQPRIPVTPAETVKEATMPQTTSPGPAQLVKEKAVKAAESAKETPATPAVAAKPPAPVQKEELTAIVEAILTSWRDHTKAYESHVITGYSGGQLTAPKEWLIRSVKADRRNPNLSFVTVFVRSTTPQGKPFQADWTFKFVRENGSWKLASW
jgi:hypothetical protein